MLIKTLEIGWHESKPIYSCDLQKGSPSKVQGTSPYRFATAGADSHVRLWLIHPTDPKAAPGAKASPKAEYLATLSKHTGAANVVRWSPDGELLASAGDDGMLIVWTKDEKAQSVWNREPTDTGLDKETWKVAHSIRVTSGEVYDIAWSPTGEYILTGSTDNTTRIFSMADNSCVKTIMEHDHYVQGVAWDPMNQFIATQSSDRSVKIYSLSTSNGKIETQSLRSNTHITLRQIKRHGQHEAVTNIAGDAPMQDDSKGKEEVNPWEPRPSKSRRSSFTESQAPGSPISSRGSVLAEDRATPSAHSASPAPGASNNPTSHSTHSSAKRLYGDENTTSFFRRLTFSPDGNLLLTPAGSYDESSANVAVESDTGAAEEKQNGKGKKKKKKSSNSCAYVYTKANFSQEPVAAYPGHSRGVVGVQFSSVLYDLRRNIVAYPSPPPASNEPSTSTSIEVPSVFKLPYRMLFAIATHDTVAVYDTQQASPICVLSGLHYDSFTDMTWSHDGQLLMLASADGYCTVVRLDPTTSPHQTQQRELQLHSDSISLRTFFANLTGAPIQNPALPSPHPTPRDQSPFVSAKDSPSVGTKRTASSIEASTSGDTEMGAGVGESDAGAADKEKDGGDGAPVKKKRRIELKHLGSSQSVLSSS